MLGVVRSAAAAMDASAVGTARAKAHTARRRVTDVIASLTVDPIPAEDAAPRAVFGPGERTEEGRVLVDLRAQVLPHRIRESAGPEEQLPDREHPGHRSHEVQPDRGPVAGR